MGKNCTIFLVVKQPEIKMNILKVKIYPIDEDCITLEWIPDVLSPKWVSYYKNYVHPNTTPEHLRWNTNPIQF